MGYEPGGATGIFFGRLDEPDELTIAFLAEQEDMMYGIASLLAEIGQENLRVALEFQPSGAVGITIEDRRDPENFQDRRFRSFPMITRFLMDFEEEKKVILTVGDLDLNMDYKRLRLEIGEIDVITSQFVN